MNKEDFSLFRISNKKKEQFDNRPEKEIESEVNTCSNCGNRYFFDKLHKKCKNCGNKIIFKKCNSKQPEACVFNFFKNKRITKVNAKNLHDDSVGKEKEKYIDIEDNCNCILI
jgi:hypothetical protein